MTADRDELVPKHPRPSTATPEEVDASTDESGAIEDPDARQAWREENRSLTERVAKTETKLDVVARQSASTHGMVKVILANSKESAKEREFRREKDANALIARKERERLDRRNKVIVAVIGGLLAVIGLIAKAFA